MTALEAATLLRQAMTLQPGDPLPGVRINPNVSVIYQSEAYAAGTVYVGTGRITSGRDHDEIAAAIGEPVDVQNTLGEHDLAQAQAVLRGRMLDYAYVENKYGWAPVNDATVAQAEKLIRAALSMRQQHVAA
jgi:hypothetical protein